MVKIIDPGHDRITSMVLNTTSDNVTAKAETFTYQMMYWFVQLYFTKMRIKKNKK